MIYTCKDAHACFRAHIFKVLFFLVLSIFISGCAAVLLSGHLSFNHYESKTGTFRCKLPGGALSSKLEVSDRSNDIGETVTFSLNLGLLWRIDHLFIGKHKLAMLDKTANSPEARRLQLDKAKEDYFNLYLAQNTDRVEVKWEQFDYVNDVEILIANTYIKWGDKEEVRELLFSIDGDYLNIIHFAQNLSSDLQTITTGAKGFYKSCQFN